MTAHKANCIGVLFFFLWVNAYGSITGTVTDTNGSPVAGALVTFTDVSIPDNEYRAYTDDITPSSTSVKSAKGEFKGQEYIDLSGSYDSDNKCWITYNYNNGLLSVLSGKKNWPVVAVTWFGAKAFARYYGYDLPTEAEWEYAARGGKQYMYGTGDGMISTSNVNYFDTGIKHPVDVGSYPANPFGLYDMCGNVWEWCLDWLGSYPSSSVTDPDGPETGSYRIVRGGCWNSDPIDCRSAFRYNFIPVVINSFIGIRVVLRP